MRAQIQRRIIVAYYGRKLLIEPRLHNGRQNIAVYLPRAVFAHASQFLVSAGEFGGICAFFAQERLHAFAHVRYRVGHVYNHFLGLFPAKVAEFFKHVVRRAEIQRRLLLRVLKFARAHNYCAEYGVLRLHKVRIPRGCHGYAQFFAQPHYSAVKLAQAVLVLHYALAHKEGVVAYRLYFKVVIFPCNGAYFLVRLFFKHRAEKLARLACGADYKPFAIEIQQAPWYPRHAFKVIYMGIGHKLIQILQPDYIFSDYYYVICAALALYLFVRHAVKKRYARLTHSLITLYYLQKLFLQRARAVNGQHGCAACAHSCHAAVYGSRVVQRGAAMVPRQLHRHGGMLVHVYAALLRLFIQFIIFFPVPYDHFSALCKLQQRVNGVLQKWGGFAVLLAYAGPAAEFLAHRHANANRSIKFAAFAVVIEAHGAYGAQCAVAMGQFYRRVFAARACPYAVRQKVALHTHYDLYINAVFLQLARRVHRRGECLHHAVVRYCNGLVAPFGCGFHGLARVYKAVHGAHLGVQVQLNSLALCLVLARYGIGFVY